MKEKRSTPGIDSDQPRMNMTRAPRIGTRRPAMVFDINALTPRGMNRTDVWIGLLPKD